MIVESFLKTQTFNVVVDAGSFVKSADALIVSKAAVSRYVVGMETRLGVQLLHRSAAADRSFLAQLTAHGSARGFFVQSESRTEICPFKTVPETGKSLKTLQNT